MLLTAVAADEVERSVQPSLPDYHLLPNAVGVDLLHTMSSCDTPYISSRVV